MRVVRFQHSDVVKYGVLQDEEKILEIKGCIYEPFEAAGNIYNFREVKILAPVEPSKIVCVGLNYKAHIDEFKREKTGVPEEPVLFMKPPTAVTGPETEIIYPESSSQVDYEAELAVVIGRKAKNVAPAEIEEYIFGYTCANDVTARDLQKKDGQWTRAKGFDTFVPLGPWVETELDVSGLRIQSWVNGELRQNSSTGNMIFNVSELVSFISGVMTLLPGDVVLTGTPEGVGPMKAGDTVKVVVEGIGELVNQVAETP